MSRSSMTRPATVAVTPVLSPSAEVGVRGLEVGGAVGDLDPVRAAWRGQSLVLLVDEAQAVEREPRLVVVDARPTAA